MKYARITTLALASFLAAAAGPALAGNYAEGDPRPVALSSTATRAAVAADAQRWVRTAPTQGYAEGESRVASAPAGNGALSRAAVAADTALWMRSGLAAVQYGEAGADASRPAYRQAANEYARLRSGAQPGYGVAAQ